jgi:fructan beta-fructosidase
MKTISRTNALRSAGLALGLLAGGAAACAPDGLHDETAEVRGEITQVPSPSSSYDEPYRGQFHFSPKAGWMNDVNGLWYWNGTYHMTYQHYPYGLTNGPMHWGHATSTDLVHWMQQPIMLAPEGDSAAWSGSTVVDTSNTSGLRTGTNPVFVTLYTCTGRGTCLAYSNDLGATWIRYAGNPLAVGAPNESTRDPHVFWHAPTSRWVMALFEDGSGTTFYTSTNLRTWTRRSSIAFGVECPDIYQLPVDGSASNQKWVLQDAGGNYLIGQFNGATFTPDAGGPYRMDVGPHFYAAQTFYRGTFPDSRVVQLAWHSNWGNSFATIPFRGAATFPVELKLRTFPEGVRLARAPVAQIASLYGTTRHWGAQTLSSGQNLLSGLTARAYDLEVVVKAVGTTASRITFQLAGKTIVYDMSARTLLDGQPLPALGGTIKIRVLVDWGQLEVFGNDGQLSYSETVAFNPGGTLSVSGNGQVALASADFRPVNRAWPGQAARSSAVTDDVALPGENWSGHWDTVLGDEIYYKGSAHFGNTTNGYFQMTFTGTRIDWYGLKNVDLGRAAVYLDGALAATVDCYSDVRALHQLFTRSSLANTSHTIKVVVIGTKNAASLGTFLVHDAFVHYVQ